MWYLRLQPILWLSLVACGGEGDGGTGSSGHAGTAGDAQADGVVDATDDGQAGSAGAAGYGGAEMVWVPAPDGGTYGIDRTEVTNEQYRIWLLGHPSVDNQPSFCAWNTDFEIQCGYEPTTYPDHPVVCIDWCDANAFCRAHGKRLCGKIGGGPTPFDAEWLADDQWYNACSSGSHYDYPYGDYYSPTTCKGADEGLDETAPVASFADCQPKDAAFMGILDLSGNVAEWLDACDGSSGATDWCRFAGGSCYGESNSLRCADRSGLHRDGAFDVVGFRCCAGL